MIKLCSRCLVAKEVADFYKDHTKPTGLSSQCIPCRKSEQRRYRNTPAGLSVAHKHNTTAGKDRDRKYRRQIRFGVSHEQLVEMFKAQDGKCANPGCLIELDEDAPHGAPNKLHLDHDHKTNKVRGLLCAGCNVALGMIHESQSRANGLAEYIRTHEGMAL